VQRRTTTRGRSATGRLAQRYDQIPTLRMKQRREGSGHAGGRQAPGKSNACVEAVWKGAPPAELQKELQENENRGKQTSTVGRRSKR
jgi:hypothetical protein